MMQYLKRKLSSDKIAERIVSATIMFLLVFFAVVVLSYFFLPQGFLKNKHPLQNWNNSENTLVLTLQIYFYNMVSAVLLVLASLFSRRRNSGENYFSTGYIGFFTMICLNGIVLGTWSFSVTRPTVPLISRIIQTFDLLHRAGLWEMMGQLLITCAAAHISIVRTTGSNSVTEKIGEIRLSRNEKWTLLTGVLLILAGAIIESNAINAL